MAPTDEEAFEALRVLRAWWSSSASAPATYDQDRLPPGVSRPAFLRRHRARVREGVEGWTRAGHARVVTLEAWEADVTSETKRRRPAASMRHPEKRGAPAPAPARAHERGRARVEDGPANDVTGELEAALGVRFRRSGP